MAIIAIMINYRQVKKGPHMQAQSIAEAPSQHPQSQTAFRNVKLLTGTYLGISVLTIVAVFLLRDNAAIAPVSVWVRGIIVVAHALLTLLFATRAARGSRVGYILLRIDSAVMFVAIAVILAIPGDFPLWFKIEQGVCGLLLLGVIVVILGKPVRSVFARK